MSESNEMLSVGAQLVGMPLAGPESFTAEQIAYLKRAMGIDETVLWEGSYSATTFNTVDSPYNYKELIFIPQYSAADKVSNDVHVRLLPGVTSINLIYTNASTLFSFVNVRLNVTSSGFSVAAGARQMYGEFTSTSAGNVQTNIEPRIVKIIGVGKISNS